MFPYDLFTLIECVENHPSLWDKTLAEYKDKIVKRNAWKAVCAILEPNFETLEEEKKNEICKSVMTKWNHIRDAFKKSLIKKSGQSQKKNYVYHNQLQFLLKVFKPDTTFSSISTEDETTQDSTSTVENESSTTAVNQHSMASTSGSQPHSTPGNRKKRMNPVDVEILRLLQSTSEVQKNNQSDTTKLTEMDDDKAFLFSVLPSIKRLPEDDRMSFRIDVMQLIRKYTNRVRTAQHSTSTHKDTTSMSNRDELILNDSLQNENANLNSTAQTSTSVNTSAVCNYIDDSTPVINVESETEAAVNAIVTTDHFDNIADLLNQDFGNIIQ